MVYVETCLVIKKHPRYGIEYCQIPMPKHNKKEPLCLIWTRAIDHPAFRIINVSDAAKILNVDRSEAIRRIQKGLFINVFQNSNGRHEYFLFEDEVIEMKKRERSYGIFNDIRYKNQISKAVKENGPIFWRRYRIW